MVNERSCFVIAPIGEQGSATRTRSDQVLKYIIRAAAEKKGYKVVRADEISEPGIITSQVINHLVSDDVVIADLSESNANVFYELAVRHAVRKPVIQLMEDNEALPFDVATTRTIYINHHDLESVEQGKKDIRSQLDSIEQKSGPFETPISVAIDLAVLKGSDDPSFRSLADVESGVGEIKRAVQSIYAKLEHPETIVPPAYLKSIISHVQMPVPKETVVPLDLKIQIANLLDQLEKHQPSNIAEFHETRALMSKLRDAFREFVQELEGRKIS